MTDRAARHGFPGWSSKQFHLRQVYQSILKHCARDLDWHFHFLAKKVGCPTLHDGRVFELVMRDCLDVRAVGDALLCRRGTLG